jgi:uncharacterized tellurite resistance protein B-like protein
MLDRIKALLTDKAGAAESGSGFDALQLAVAVLLVEAARMDSEFDADERQTVQALLARRFELDAGAAGRLLAQAERKAEGSVELYGFTRTVKDAFEHEDRVELMQMLWEVAYADGTLHDYEANLMRRVAGLVHVTDRESGEARKRALDRLGLQG